MQIGPETVVIFHYTLRNEEGEELETSRGGEPTAYLHGANNIIPGLEEAMEGRESGETFGESLAVTQEDHHRLGSTILLQACKHDRVMPFTPPVEQHCDYW